MCGGGKETCLCNLRPQHWFSDVIFLDLSFSFGTVNHNIDTLYTPVSQRQMTEGSISAFCITNDGKRIVR